MNRVMNRPFLVLTVIGLFLGTTFVANNTLASEDIHVQTESIVERYFSSLQNEDFDSASNLIKDKRFSSKSEQMEFYKEVSENDQILAYNILEIKSLDKHDFVVAVEVVSSLARTYTIDLSISKNDSGEWILADFTPLLIGGQEAVRNYVVILETQETTSGTGGSVT